MASVSGYSVPREAEQLLQNQILGNPLMTHLPRELRQLSKHVHFSGNARPSIPVNWRWAESISALKAFEATMLNHLLTRKYAINPVDVTINTDHASLFIFSPHLVSIVHSDSETTDINFNTLQPTHKPAPPAESQYRLLATGIYRTKDDRFYHIHGSLNPDHTLTALGLALDGEPDETIETAVSKIQQAVCRFDAAELDELMNSHYRQAGTIAYSSEEYFSSEHGQANANIGLYELVRDKESSQPASWWPDHDSFPSSPKRPLAGLKVVDLTRVYAGPTITAGLAELGASVMRVTSPDLPDFTTAFRELNWGKWNCELRLGDEEDKKRLRDLILHADVVVDGYRPGALERLGFGRDDVFEIVKQRGRGIIHVRENCYGWHGPWSGRSGWQGISDASCGVSLAYGQSMGVNEPVTPPFPNSDRCTGVVGCSAVLHALVDRSENGGSHGVDTSLNYYSQWLVRSCGTYPDHVWDDLWRRHGSPVFRHYDNTRRTVPELMRLLHEYDEAEVFQSSFFAEYHSKALDVTMRKLAPVAQFDGNNVELKYNVGARGNGVDEARWPDDLLAEIVH